MNAPPSLPSLEFRYDTKALYLLTAFGWGCGLFAVYGAIDILLHFRTFGMFNILYGTLIVLAGFVGWAGIFFFFHRFGCKIHIRNGMLRVITRSGKVRAEGYVTEIAELHSLFHKAGDMPMEYLVIFTNGKKLRFESQIENLADLIKALEQRSGKTFVLTQRKQV